MVRIKMWMKLKCPACGYESEENDEQFVEIEGSSLTIRTEQTNMKSITLFVCLKCKNIFME